jgi:hypothetical protein
MPLVVVYVANRLQRRQPKDFWDVVVRAMEEEEVRTVVLGHQVPIQPAVDNGGRKSGATLVRLRGRQPQAGEGRGGGATP